VLWLVRAIVVGIIVLLVLAGAATIVEAHHAPVVVSSSYLYERLSRRALTPVGPPLLKGPPPAPSAARSGLAVWEWGAPDAPPILFAHGGFDFAGTYDTLAPRVADAGWRVVSWDQRGHGDSDHAQLYSWDADVRDAAAVLATLGPDPVPVLGHSKGGALMLRCPTGSATW
jgi:pimeloyl-ACP methyl ester carboxylesterase